MVGKFTVAGTTAKCPTTPSCAESGAPGKRTAYSRGVSPDLTSHPAVSALRAALTDRGFDPDFRVLPDAVKTAQAAADALVMASGGHRVDTTYLAQALGLVSLDRADPDFVRTHTGMAIGGVAPVGHPTPLRTVVDTYLEQFEQVWAAGGHSHAVFRTSYADLLAMTDGTASAVTP